MSVAVACGVGIGIATPASAQTFGSYKTEAQCLAAKAARGGRGGRGLACTYIAETGSTASWVLSGNLGGG
ncbi:hypothetical protein ACWC09_52595 [Streptomyces sp. NPDC001617]